MKNPIRSIQLALLICLVFLIDQAKIQPASAAGEGPPGPDRYSSVVEEYPYYTWWLARWSDSRVLCEFDVDHESTPTNSEILQLCGVELFNLWLDSEPCEFSTTAPELCSGYYLHFVEEGSASRVVPIKLPEPVVWVILDGCTPQASTHRCSDWPVLVLIGEEPLSGYSIVGLEGTIDGRVFSCDSTCQIELGMTDEDGIEIRVWAHSSYGDSSDAFKLRVRVNRSDNLEDTSLYVDVLSRQWRGSEQAPHAIEWDVFPPVGGLDGWLSTPRMSGDLESHIPYEYLAGKLIEHGVVDADVCPTGGLLENGYADVCGMEIARFAVDEWQNQFDEIILSAARDVGIPAQLLKNLFSRESQFWPGVSIKKIESGMGQLTENGADTTLLWNLPFYEQFCPTILDTDRCQKGYSHLSDGQRLSLRLALVNSVDAFCADCPLGLDLDKAHESIFIFAETVVANCEQMRMVLDLNYSDNNYQPTYEDLWRFTLVNYNAGPGCLGLAVHQTRIDGDPLDWDHLAANLTPACRGAYEYVLDISQITP